MPKIANHVIKIHGEKITESYKVEINYNSSEGFYIRVPEILLPAYSHLTDQDKITHNASFFYKRKMDHYNGKGTPIVSGDSEANVCENARKLFLKLAQSAITERPVILIFYEDKETGRNHHTTQGFDPTGLEFGLTFCIETSVAGGDPVYYEYTERERFGEPVIDRRAIHVWNSNCTIIDDTPGNKEFVINLYKALKELRTKMKNFTSTSEKFLQLIASNQKLLN